jgi:hypothetical protein
VLVYEVPGFLVEARVDDVVVRGLLALGDVLEAHLLVDRRLDLVLRQPIAVERVPLDVEEVREGPLEDLRGVPGHRADLHEPVVVRLVVHPAQRLDRGGEEAHDLLAVLLDHVGLAPHEQVVLLGVHVLEPRDDVQLAVRSELLDAVLVLDVQDRRVDGAGGDALEGGPAGQGDELDIVGGEAARVEDDLHHAVARAADGVTGDGLPFEVLAALHVGVGRADEPVQRVPAPERRHRHASAVERQHRARRRVGDVEVAGLDGAGRVEARLHVAQRHVHAVLLVEALLERDIRLNHRHDRRAADGADGELPDGLELAGLVRRLVGVGVVVDVGVVIDVGVVVGLGLRDVVVGVGRVRRVVVVRWACRQQQRQRREHEQPPAADQYRPCTAHRRSLRPLSVRAEGPGACLATRSPALPVPPRP